MRRSIPGVVVATFLLGVVGCSDGATSTSMMTAPTSLRADRGSGDHMKVVNMFDECDPTTFNAAVGPGSCTRPAGVKFDKFVAELTQMQVAPQWHFAPDNVTLRVGDVLASRNMGGETHTFTEVKAFGGGIVPFLNALAGTPKVAPECQALALSDFVAPGGMTSEVTDEAGDEMYQCCIHPWMRAVVHIAEK